MSASRCRPGALRHASLPLRDALDALDVVVAARHQPEHPETLALLLDHAHRGRTILVVDGCATADQVLEVGGFLCGEQFGASGIGALVLATVRPGRPGRSEGPVPDDHLAFAPLRAAGEAAGIAVLDWFVMTGAWSWSLAELTDAVPLWRGGR